MRDIGVPRVLHSNGLVRHRCRARGADDRTMNPVRTNRRYLQISPKYRTRASPVPSFNRPKLLNVPA